MVPCIEATSASIHRFGTMKPTERKVFYRNKFDPKRTIILLPKRTADSHVVVLVIWIPII